MSWKEEHRAGAANRQIVDLADDEYRGMRANFRRARRRSAACASSSEVINSARAPWYTRRPLSTGEIARLIARCADGRISSRLLQGLRTSDDLLHRAASTDEFYEVACDRRRRGQPEYLPRLSTFDREQLRLQFHRITTYYEFRDGWEQVEQTWDYQYTSCDPPPM
jgi:hypothetical protein